MRSHSIRRSLAALLVAAACAAPALASAEPPSSLSRAEALLAQGDYAGAEKILLTLQGGKERAAALLAKARIQLLTGRYDDAATTAKAAAALGKEARIAAAPLRAEALARRGKMAEAIAAVREVEREDEARRARLVLGELLIASGKRGEARAPLMTLIDDYNDDKIAAGDAEGLSLVGRAAHLLRSARDANDAFNAAEKVGGKQRVETLLWRAELYLDKYDPGHAGQVVKEALKLAPKDPLSRVAMARVKLENAMDFGGADSEVAEALSVNPNLAEAYFVRAGLALRDMDIDAADAAADRGLKVNPNDLALLSIKAAGRFLADDAAGFEAIKAKVLGLNPEFSRFFQIVGEFAEWEHRYDDIVKMMGEATRVDPNDAKAYATLGLNLIRAGDEKGGVLSLQQAWDKDRFNVRVFNTLNLYEKDIATQYVTVEGQTFRVRYHKQERAILERYLPRMLEEAWGSMVKRYGFTPKVPVSIELYASTENFSVRTSGLPNVGIQGVCFGQTLAALSPAAAEFNWGNVLWHELGHVFAIQLSKNHVPRWFTEGLSEYETIVRRPEWHREEDPALFAALKGGRIPAVDGFNRAFTHVDNIEDVTMAYFAASQIVVFMVDEFGFSKVVSMLPRWAAGKRTPEVVKESLGISAEELDRRFRAWLAPRLDRYEKQYVPDLHAPPLDDARKAAARAPKDAKRLVELALALFEDGQRQEGEAVLAEALRIDPKQPDATYLKVRAAFAEKKPDEAARLLSKMIADGHDGYVVRMKLADLAELKKDTAKMKANLEAASRQDPTQAEPLQGLYDLARRQKDAAGELSALRRLALLDQHDRRVWRRLLRLLVERGAWEEARKVGEGAIFVDVANPEIHRLYARALARTGRHVSAIYELNSALLAGSKPGDAAEIYGELAKAYAKMKRDDYAKQALEYQKAMRGASPPAPRAMPD
ncbi:tetratricopeptide repeat protein [Sorangium sp. So ce1000]|uniref:tetratricopeptide repeat protein n=1 Tax=Sorangium sp. So ce1000 TaxID=3133325 RepID=UPI003F61A839